MEEMKELARLEAAELYQVQSHGSLSQARKLRALDR